MFGKLLARQLAGVGIQTVPLSRGTHDKEEEAAGKVHIACSLVVRQALRDRAL